MKTIILTQGKIALVDDDMYDYLSQWKWQAVKIRNVWYVRRTEQSNYTKKSIAMHRVIMKITNSKIKVDHEDHDGLNNKKSNLRICTSQQNRFNSNSVKNSTSKYLGVFLWKGKIKNKVYSYWQANIQNNGKKKYLGNFKSEEDAAHAYDREAIIARGSFANLNFKQVI